MFDGCVAGWNDDDGGGGSKQCIFIGGHDVNGIPLVGSHNNDGDVDKHNVGFGDVCNLAVGGGRWLAADIVDASEEVEADGGGTNLPALISSWIARNSRNCCCFFSLSFSRIKLIFNDPIGPSLFLSLWSSS